ncbi:hypothetical protein [Burkholderia multivorans]|uniref:hypothetical protein n=1 Tax=Burkholderia multivorans TaxID=87883 RepID=UPI002018F5B7|nr:hypothetical protein [Burkholderia multivorans]MCL4652471.1 hypothetical protein [Burkholderia multivorans]MCL4654300.1 hypothetical protein [Burkholderia multivorans]MCO1426979.1 hypothetical protein [Burkholderia multivorans]UQN53374.1 hypothetical protein L0Y88_04590 [Burkholderia multivorans]UQN82281.1 hypothetical protein L0Z18_24010 [Burkholderia multivorans]
MKLIATNLIKPTEDAPNPGSDVTVTAIAGGYSVDCAGQTLTVDGAAFKPSQMQFIVAGPGRIGMVDQATYVDARDWPALMTRLGFEREIGALYCGVASDEMALLISASCTTAAEVTDAPPGPPAQVIGTVYPGALALRRRNAAKLELLREINPMDSLAALEQQVDLLTALVQDLAALVPGSDGVTLLPKVRDLVQQHGANAARTEDEALAAITAFKAPLRARIAEYFARRAV